MMIYTDGQCIGNNQKDLSKRKSIICIVLEPDENAPHEIVTHFSEAKSSNEAEWHAIVYALEYWINYCKRTPFNKEDPLMVMSDSNNSVQQYNPTENIPKLWQTKKHSLIIYRNKAWNLAREHNLNVKVRHIDREINPAGIELERRVYM